MKLFTHFSANNINLKEMPFNAELAMEAYIIENENVLKIDEDDQIQIIDFELSLRYGRQSKSTDGRIDLLALYNNNKLGIIELKNGKLIKDHFNQLNDYFLVKDKVFENNFENINDTMDWIGILVGTDIEDDLLNEIESGSLVIQNGIPLIVIIIKRYRAENGQVYIITESYTSRKHKRDYSKYKFNNNIYQKGRLVLAIITQYVADHPDITLQDLQKIFCKKLSGGMDVIIDAEDAKNRAVTPNSKGKIYRWHFIKEDEIILLKNGQRVAVLDWWDKDNLPNILKIAKNNNYKVEKM
jgi:hypothetical protein